MTQKSPHERASFWLFGAARNPVARFMNRLSLGGKLNLGFGILVLLTLIVVGISYFNSEDATRYINLTRRERVPAASAAASAQANLLRMLSASRAYLAVDDDQARAEFLQAYIAAQQAFENDLTRLGNLEGVDTTTLTNLNHTYRDWKTQQSNLFALSDDPLAREPALRTLLENLQPAVATISQNTANLLAAQAAREPSQANTELLANMATFQSTFFQTVSGLRGYVTTRNENFQFEYQTNLLANQAAWVELEKNGAQLTPSEKEFFNIIDTNRSEFLRLLEPMINQVESEQYREDLYQFRTNIVPTADGMLTLLESINTAQQRQLRLDLRTGWYSLAVSRQLTLIGGIVALLIALSQAFIFRENIAGPIQRLTAVAERIRQGHLEAQAKIETGDEIGVLANTFNSMTGQLNQTLQQVQKEKKRADDLLNVVIPIGVDLTTERDFNRLLEKMLVVAQNFCYADVGVLYLATEDKFLHVASLRDVQQGVALGGTTQKPIPFAAIPFVTKTHEFNQPRHIAVQAAVSGQTLNLADAAQHPEFDSVLRGEGNLHITGTSWLTIPLKSPTGRVLGVLQLINAHDQENDQVIAFDANLQQMMESFSSLAVAALEAYIREQALRLEIRQLRIEIDEAKRQKQVAEIVETETFRNLQTKARELRARKQAKLEGG